ncbi:MAG: cytochrome-c oxidase, cbb3-type subunit III [Brevirhabdus sp.]
MSNAPEEKKNEHGFGTTGHEWDGIEEWNNPLPRWWVWTFYICIVWGIGYSIAYPAWPLMKEATPGLLGFSTRANVAADIEAVNKANAEIDAKLAAADLTTIDDDQELKQYAFSGGAAVFKTFCSQCHGSGAGGSQGHYPNLLDDDWLWGGDIESIHDTIAHGIRYEQDEDTRLSDMPAFGEMLEADEIDQVVQHVLNISGQEHDAAKAELGAVVFEDNCSGCHAEDGTGDIYAGAPNLTDAIWLFGGDTDAITTTVTYARNSIMPAWSGRLSDAQINAVATYVHSLGGGQ